MYIKKPATTHNLRNHKLLIIIIILLFTVSCSDPEVSLEKITISGEVSISESIEINQPINLTIFMQYQALGFKNIHFMK